MAIGYGIFSGGLDSMLAALVLADIGVDVRLITFSTPFFTPEKALESGRSIGHEPRVVDITGPHMQMMKKPKHGFGRFMNPCIDCHALMFNTAGGIMMDEGGDFLFSGEVLGQRPKSQNRRALDIVAHASGYADFILRPLSAKTLPATRMETEGLVDREGLLGLSGRTRKPQMELAARFGLDDYPSPAGGCLLTDIGFSRRLRDLMDHVEDPDPAEVEMLKYGRHFRLPGGTKAIVGRNRSENEALENLVRPRDMVVKAPGVPGPTVVLPGAAGRTPPEDLSTAAALAVSYSDVKDGQKAEVQARTGSEAVVLEAESLPKKGFADWMV